MVILPFFAAESAELLNTGSSNLATVYYVHEPEAGGGGCQIQREQLRLEPKNALRKMGSNAQGAPTDEDFHVQCLSYLAGTLRCQFFQASTSVETSQLIRTNTIDTYSITNVPIPRNG